MMIANTNTFSVSSPTVTEGKDPYACFTITLSAPSSTTNVLALSLSDGSGSATAANGGGVDYGNADAAKAMEISFDGVNWEPATSISIPPNCTTAYVRTAIADDSVVEGKESFTLDVDFVSGDMANDCAEGTATIIDNDVVSTTATLSVSDVTVTEGADKFAVFTVSLDKAVAHATALNLALSAGTATGDGVDFGSKTATNLQVSTDGGKHWTNAASTSIAAGATSVLVRTPIVDDALVENAEKFSLKASTTNVEVGNTEASGTATIVDNDAAVLRVGNVTVTEGVDHYAQFTVSLSKVVTTEAISFDLKLADGSAKGAGVDFGASTQVSSDGGKTWATASTATIEAGKTSVLVRTAITDDTLIEKTEDFSLTATRTCGHTANDSAKGTATIIDNDFAKPPNLSVSDVTVHEGGDKFAVFTVSLDHIASGPTGLQLDLHAGSASNKSVTYVGADQLMHTGGADFGTGVAATELEVSVDGGKTWTVGHNVTIAAGQSSVLARTAITDDLQVEGAEKFTLVATQVSGVRLCNGTATGTATIFDNDSRPVGPPVVAGPEPEVDRRTSIVGWLDGVSPAAFDSNGKLLPVTSPLILDLDGNGVKSTALAEGTKFDHNADGVKEHTGWVGQGDGLLALDLNHNGQIDTGRELFGNNTLLADGSKAANGFAGLAQYDANHDGKIDAKDAIYSQLQVWKDANGNGVTDAGELSGLAANKVASIDLGYTTSDLVVNGNAYAQVGSYTDAGGAKHGVTDVWFQTDANAPKLDMRDVVGVDQGIPLPGTAPSAATAALMAAVGPHPAPLDLHGLLPQQSLAHELFANEHVMG